MAGDDQREPDSALEVLTTVPGSAEATIVVGDLGAAGIHAVQRPGSQSGGLWGTLAACDILVAERDLDRARELLDGQTLSEDELLQAEEEAASAQLEDRET